jgi:hypothetical protein
MDKQVARAHRKKAKKNTKRLRQVPTRGKLLLILSQAPKNNFNSHPLKPVPFAILVQTRVIKRTATK